MSPGFSWKASLHGRALEEAGGEGAAEPYACEPSLRDQRAIEEAG